LVLASRSPQRRAILERLGVAFTVRPTDVEEFDRGDPGEVALENALRKARAAQQLGAEAGGAEELVLGCDTLVALDGAIYGKPRDERDARKTLRALGGATHEVLSGLALLGGGDDDGDGASERADEPERTDVYVRTMVVRTAVTFRELDDGMLDWYLAQGEWRGRAGGYAIQGAGAALVRSVEGDYENVVGLPLAALLDICPSLLAKAR
jgi:septum formation protein